MSEGVDPELRRRKTHVRQPGSKPPEVFGLLDGDESSGGRRDEEDGGFRREELGPVHVRQHRDGPDGTEHRIWRGTHRDLVTSFSVLDRLRDGNNDFETMWNFHQVTPLQDVTGVEFVAIFWNHVGRSEGRLEQKKCERTEGCECLESAAAQGRERGGPQKVHQDGRGYGTGFLDSMLQLPLEAVHDDAEGAVRSGCHAVEAQLAVKGANRRQVSLNTFGGLESTDGVQPNSVVAHLFTSEREGVDVSEAGEFLEGSGLTREGLPGTRGPGVGDDDSPVLFQQLDQT